VLDVVLLVIINYTDTFIGFEMSKFRALVEIDAPDAEQARIHIQCVSGTNVIKVSKVRGPLGKRKKWMIVWNGQSYAGIQNNGFTKTQAIKEMMWHKRIDKRKGIKRTYSLAEYTLV
jgi:hypothetical protein